MIRDYLGLIGWMAGHLAIVLESSLEGALRQNQQGIERGRRRGRQTVLKRTFHLSFRAPYVSDKKLPQ